MNHDLVRRHNSVVEHGDTVWIVGDFSLSAGALGWASQLNGHKILVPGNHDKCWSGRHGGKGTQARQLYSDAGFEQITDRPDPMLIANHNVIINHFPYQRSDPTQPVADSHDIERHVHNRPVDRGDWLLHGHVHEKWLQQGRMINVGVDAWGGFPVGVPTLAGVIRGGPAELAPMPWS
jgi:calcineurin-like phosphoesterase family protein